jgi:hypothetical protein
VSAIHGKHFQANLSWCDGPFKGSVFGMFLFVTYFLRQNQVLRIAENLAVNMPIRDCKIKQY